MAFRYACESELTTVRPSHSLALRLLARSLLSSAVLFSVTEEEHDAVMQGDFREWGRKSALTMRSAFNLLNVRSHPTYEQHRQFYLMNSASAGWGEGLIM